MVKYFIELYKFRELLFTLTWREIKVRYKQTALGAAWAIVQPLSLMILFTLVFGIFMKIETRGIPYPIFSYSALVPWTFFSTSLSFGAIALINNSSLITKIYFPRETLPFSSIGAALLDFAVASGIFVVMMIFYRTPITINFLYTIPIILILIIFTAGITLFMSALVVIWRDIKFVIPLLLQLWLFVTPVIYPINQVPGKFRLIFILNPMGPIIEGFRAATIQGKPPEWLPLLIASLVAFVTFFGGYIYFKSQEKKFADVI